MADFPDWTVPTNIQNPQIDVRVTEGTINANITNAELDVNITESQVQLSVGSVEYRASNIVLKNPPTDNITWISVDKYYGKFFPHQALGHLHKIRIRVRNTDTTPHTLYIYAQPWPSVHNFVSGQASLSAGFDGWVEVQPKIFWPWDSILIIIKADSDAVQVEAGDAENYDSYYAYSWSWWYVYNKVLNIEVHVNTHPSNPVYILGQVTAVKPPSTLKNISTDYINVGPGETTALLDCTGRGEIKFIAVYWRNVASSKVRLWLEVDDVKIPREDTYWMDYCYRDFGVNTPNPFCFGRFDTSNIKYTFLFKLKMRFNRKFRIMLYNGDTSNTLTAKVISCIYVLY